MNVTSKIEIVALREVVFFPSACASWPIYLALFPWASRNRLAVSRHADAAPNLRDGARGRRTRAHVTP